MKNTFKSLLLFQRIILLQLHLSYCNALRRQLFLTHSFINLQISSSSLSLWRSQRPIARERRKFLPLSTSNWSSTSRRWYGARFTIVVARKPAARAHASSVTASACATRHTARPASGSTWRIRSACASLTKRRRHWSRRGEGSEQTASLWRTKPNPEGCFSRELPWTRTSERAVGISITSQMKQ